MREADLERMSIDIDKISKILERSPHEEDMYDLLLYMYRKLKMLESMLERDGK